jgi:hypothetical protein
MLRHVAAVLGLDGRFTDPVKGDMNFSQVSL